MTLCVGNDDDRNEHALPLAPDKMLHDCSRIGAGIHNRRMQECEILETAAAQASASLTP